MRRLELGSGWRPTPGFTHLDVNATMPSVDIVGSAYPLPAEVRAQLWDELRAVDVLEHLSYRDTDAVLRDWASVLKQGGLLFVQVPDADRIMRWYMTDDDRLLNGIPQELPRTHFMGATWRLLGGHLDGERARNGDDFRWNAHYAMFSADSLANHLEAAGFRVVSCTINQFPNLQFWAEKQ